MKKHILILLFLCNGFIALAQRSNSKSEKISYATHENNTEQSLKGSFPIVRLTDVKNAFFNSLGKSEKLSTSDYTWNGNHYSAYLSQTGFKANLDKEQASAQEIAMFKRLIAALYKALDQPQPPKTPKTEK